MDKQAIVVTQEDMGLRSEFLRIMVEALDKGPDMCDWSQDQMEQAIGRFRIAAIKASGERATLAWQPIETAPMNKPVLLAWEDRAGKWLIESDCAGTGQRFDNGYSTVSMHGSATHWMPLPAPPAIRNQPTGDDKGGDA